MSSNKGKNSGNDGLDKNPISNNVNWGGNIDPPEDHHSLPEWDNRLWAVLKKMEASPTNEIGSAQKSISTKIASHSNSINGAVTKALFNLPLMYREVLDLYDNQDYSLSEIAEIIDTDIAGVKWRIISARKQFREQLPQYFSHKDEQIINVLADERAELPVDKELKSLLKQMETPSLPNSLEDRLQQAYRAQVTPAQQPFLNLKAIKERFLLALIKSFSAPLPMAAALVILISTVGITYWIFKKPAINNGLDMNVVNTSPTPTQPPVRNITPTPVPKIDPENLQASDPKQQPNHKRQTPRQHERETDLPVMPPIERNGNANVTLSTIKTLYVDLLGPDAGSQQLRQLLIARLANTGRWRVLSESDVDQADGVFEISPQDNETILLVSNGKVIWKKKVDMHNSDINNIADTIVSSLLSAIH